MNLIHLLYSNYFISLILQGFCVFHCMRKGHSNQWLWLIIFLPFIGSLIYLFTIVLTRDKLNSVTSNVNTVVRPHGNLKQLERNLKFSDTFQNRMSLANYYQALGRDEEALALYEQNRHGLFANEPELITAMMRSNYAVNEYEKVNDLAKLVNKHPNFIRSQAHLSYARSLEKLGKYKEAETEYEQFNTRYADFEGKYTYACFLENQQRFMEATQLLDSAIDESRNMGYRGKRNHIFWIRQSIAKRKELEKGKHTK
ncbi:MAG: hypothetical protein K0S23_1975 [Fluviicola sp.]|uniref:PLDc N-terminal domain-containing protein n=1 Tax=Fluviicola sp. TaxID=1917219 RepID=UPI0026163ED1|nr:PLDc N-terminal domain-containing protein [Fluviicola sp.]MDF3027668.1 hypothetical protein [Fluviicola sp.]